MLQKSHKNLTIAGSSKLIKFRSESPKQTSCWVPGHSGVDGNESGWASCVRIWTLHPIAMCEGFEELSKYKALRTLVIVWGRSTWHFLSESTERWIRDLLNMDRNRIRRAVGAFTGHCDFFKLFLYHTWHDATCGIQSYECDHSEWLRALLRTRRGDKLAGR